MFSSLSVFALLATSAWGHSRRLPGVKQEPRDTSCAGLGQGSTDTTSYGFTLAALNTTVPNSSKNGVSLVLGWSASESDEEDSDWDMSVSPVCFVFGCRSRLSGVLAPVQIQVEWNSESADWPYFTLESGSLIPQPSSLQQGLSAHDRSIAPGEEVGFSVNTAGSSQVSPASHCAMVCRPCCLCDAARCILIMMYARCAMARCCSH